MQSRVRDERGKTDRIRRLQEGCNHGSEHHHLPTCAKEKYNWKMLESKTPGSLLGDLKQQALLKPSSFF